jgi:(p)ppGpp synthase/HD superfamily hydrolase
MNRTRTNTEIALEIVEKEFAYKVDKAGEPYINHLKRVSENVRWHYPYSDDMKDLESIALLHDLIEDSPIWTPSHLEAIFKSTNIPECVSLLTRPDNLDYNGYIERLAPNKFARAVKLADLKDNMDLTRLPVITEADIERVKKYHKAFMFLINYTKNEE